MKTTPEIFQFQFPVENEPSWSQLVERWYQLDPFSYGLCEAIHQWEAKDKPEAILLASPGASNLMDRQFVESGASSPAKFVYTLPNVRGAPLCQALQWAGPLWCFQRDPFTITTALQEAQLWIRQHSPIWVMGVAAKKTSTQDFVAYRFVISEPCREEIQQISDFEFFRTLKF